MTRQETLMMMGLLKVAYPQYYARQSREEVSAAVGLWQMMFAQDEAQAVAAAVKAFIATDTKGFPPGIGQIKENLDKLRVEAEGGELTAMEAWQLVRRAIGNSYYHAAEEFEKLPDTVRAVLGGPSALHDYANMDEATVNSVVASHFQRSFAARRDHAAQMRKWPQDVRALAQGKAAAAIAGAPAENRLRTGEEAEKSGAKTRKRTPQADFSHTQSGPPGPTESAHSAGGGKTCR